MPQVCSVTISDSTCIRLLTRELVLLWPGTAIFAGMLFEGCSCQPSGWGPDMCVTETSLCGADLFGGGRRDRAAPAVHFFCAFAGRQILAGCMAGAPLFLHCALRAVSETCAVMGQVKPVPTVIFLLWLD